jgi:hypothetical protein
MKKIEPISIWNNGKFENANTFGLNVSGGVLFESAVFSYILCKDDDESQIQLQQGTLQMIGDDYLAWGNDDEYAYNWAAAKLNLVLIPE